MDIRIALRYFKFFFKITDFNLLHHKWCSKVFFIFLHFLSVCFFDRPIRQDSGVIREYSSLEALIVIFLFKITQLLNFSTAFFASWIFTDLFSMTITIFV